MKNEETHEPCFRGTWCQAFIHRMVWSREIEAWEAYLLMYIDCLCHDTGQDCFASNKYLADRMGVSETSVKRSIAKLKKLDLLIETGFDGRKRYLTPPWAQHFKRGVAKQTGQFDLSDRRNRPSRQTDLTCIEDTNRLEDSERLDSITLEPLASTPPGSSKTQNSRGKRKPIREGMDDTPKGEGTTDPRVLDKQEIQTYQQAFNAVWKKRYAKNYTFEGGKHTALLKKIRSRMEGGLRQFKFLVNIFIEDPKYTGHGLSKLYYFLDELISVMLPEHVKPVTPPATKPTSQPAPPAKPVERVYATRVTKAEENLEMFYYDGALNIAKRIKDPEYRKQQLDRAEEQEARLLLALAKAKREEKLNPTWTKLPDGQMVSTRKLQEMGT